MKKELTYFGIDGCVGGNQEWFTNVVMYMGGCAAATACDSCIYFAKEYGMKGLYPYDLEHLSRKDYVRFGQKMKPYIRPRIGGVRRLEWYVDGLSRYMDEAEREHRKNYGIRMETFSGARPFSQAAETVEAQLEAGMPVPYLMLKHRDAEQFKDFVWHWFLVTGCEGTGERMTVTAATYGEAVKLPFSRLWHTGYEEKGGMILYSLG